MNVSENIPKWNVLNEQRRKKNRSGITLTGSQKRPPRPCCSTRKKMGVAAPMGRESLMGERGTWLLCVSSHYNAVSYALYGDSPDREAVSACLRGVPGRVPYRVKRGLGWRSPGPIYITLEVGESASRDREREKERRGKERPARAAAKTTKGRERRLLGESSYRERRGSRCLKLR